MLKRYAISVSITVVATAICVFASFGSIQNTAHDIATMRMSGRMTLITKWIDRRAAAISTVKPASSTLGVIW